MENVFLVEPKVPLYHYTSAAGLIGILNTRSIWASSVHCLNDSAEMQHATALLNDLLLHKLRHERGPWNDLYGALLEALPEFAEFQILVASFSEKGDLLSQWRAYCREGDGFSVGFSPDFLGERAKAQNFLLAKCVYDLEQQKRICLDLINQACAEAAIKTTDEERASTMIDAVIPKIIRIAPALKHPSFVEEEEWRLIGGPFALNDEHLDFRPGRYGVIPYFKFSLQCERGFRIKEIVAGPAPDKKKTVESAKYLVGAKGIPCERVIPSTATYRGW